jgi:UDP-N-acetylmuramyl pentapeptide phosphotransferase/UDP-N-acetylglucosamine-1-phosphate transferase
MAAAGRRPARRSAGGGARRPVLAASPAASAVTALIAAGAARAAYAALTRNPPGGPGRWTRTNHRGEPVTLLEGPAAAAAGAVAASVAAGIPARQRAALAVASAGAAVFGGYDDLAGSGDRRGFRGHLGALAHGQVTTGAVKIAGIGATGIAAGALTGGPAMDLAINSALVAGTANLLNLFDLRPGRAIKVVLATGLPLAASQLAIRPAGPGASAGRPAGAAAPGGAAPAAAAVAPLGAALALLPDDLGERAMLGDAGANALGAMLGTAAAIGLSRRSRVAMLTAVTALTAASEVVSFTKVIERTPPLRWLDMLGRRPVAPRPAGDRSPDAGPAPVAATSAGAPADEETGPSALAAAHIP